MALISVLRSLSLDSALSVLLTLMVFLHGTLLAPQLTAAAAVATSAAKRFSAAKILFCSIFGHLVLKLSTFFGAYVTFWSPFCELGLLIFQLLSCTLRFLHNLHT